MLPSIWPPGCSIDLQSRPKRRTAAGWPAASRRLSGDCLRLCRSRSAGPDSVPNAIRVSWRLLVRAWSRRSLETLRSRRCGDCVVEIGS
jgi:hypothetical protein